MVQRHLSESFSECCLNQAFGPCFSGLIDVGTDVLIRQLAKATALQLNILEREQVTSNTMTIRGFAFQFESEICVQYHWKSDVRQPSERISARDACQNPWILAPGGSSATLLRFCIH
jgi:hypothetical protein